jgi:hypothetical protein
MSEKRGRGQPPFEPTDSQRQLVRVLVSNGNGMGVIAQLIGRDPKTIRRAFRDELRNGREFVVAQMGAALVRAGMGGNVFALRYWLATHGGPEWRESRHIEVADAPSMVNGRDVRDMSAAEIEAEIEAIRRRREMANQARASIANLPKSGSVH